MDARILKLASISVALLLIQACSHPIEIEGQGDVKTLSGNRTCMFEGDDFGETNCSRNYVVFAYQETYYPEPRPGWQFSHWGNYCTTVTLPPYECSFTATAEQVKASWGLTVPPLKAVFVTQCGDNIVAGIEECDDGNQVNTDECTNTCTIKNPVSDVVTVSAPKCQEDKTCTFTITGSDVDPDDTHSIEVLSIFYDSPRELTHNANPVVNGQVFTVPTSGLVFTYKTLPDTCPSSELVMQFSATKTPPASSGIAPTYQSLAEVFVSHASVDDAPTASDTVSVLPYVGSAETIPAGTSVMLSFPVTQRDLLCSPDEYQIIFPTLPDPAVGVLKFNDGGSPELVVANQPINCGLGSCANQISFELTSDQPTNQVIATFDYTARDNTVAQLSSSALVTIRPSARNVPLLEPTHSHSFNYAEGSTGSVMVVKIRQPENFRYADMHLAVWSYPMITVAASPNDLTHTSGVVFASSADRIDGNGELYHPRDTLLSPGAVETPKVIYAPVSDCSALDICEFHIAVRACNAGEVSDPAAPCDPNYAGTSSFTISVQPTSNGWNSGPGFEFQNELTVTNDQLDAGATFVSFKAGLDSMGNEVCPDPSGGPFELYNADLSPHAAALSTDLHYCTQDSTFRLFDLGMVNDEISASSWRMDVTVFWDTGGGYIQTSATTVTLSPEGVANAPGVTTSFADGVFSVSHTDLLTLRQAAYFGFDIDVESFGLPVVVRAQLFADNIPTSEPVYVEVYKSNYSLTNAPTLSYPSETSVDNPHGILSWLLQEAIKQGE